MNMFDESVSFIIEASESPVKQYLSQILTVGGSVLGSAVVVFSSKLFPWKSSTVDQGLTSQDMPLTDQISIWDSTAFQFLLHTSYKTLVGILFFAFLLIYFLLKLLCFASSYFKMFIRKLFNGRGIVAPPEAPSFPDACPERVLQPSSLTPLIDGSSHGGEHAIHILAPVNNSTINLIAPGETRQPSPTRADAYTMDYIKAFFQEFNERRRDRGSDYTLSKHCADVTFSTSTAYRWARLYPDLLESFE